MDTRIISSSIPGQIGVESSSSTEGHCTNQVEQASDPHYQAQFSPNNFPARGSSSIDTAHLQMSQSFLKSIAT